MVGDDVGSDVVGADVGFVVVGADVGSVVVGPKVGENVGAFEGDDDGKDVVGDLLPPNFVGDRDGDIVGARRSTTTSNTLYSLFVTSLKIGSVASLLEANVVAAK